MVLEKCNKAMSIATIITLFFFCGCQKKAETDQDVHAFRPPSAMEAFELQSKCAMFGQKILENNRIGSALTQEQVSHYNDRDNRRYVRLTVSTADLTTPMQNFTNDEYLYDGQTSEMLAMRSSKGAVKYADVYDNSMKKMMIDPDHPSPEEVRGLMDTFMRLERRH